MKLSRLTIALYVGLIFACGVVLGVFGHSLYAVTTVRKSSNLTPEALRKKRLAEMQVAPETFRRTVRENQLDHGRNARQICMKCRERYRPEIDGLEKAQRDKVRSILSADQRAEYEKMLKEREQQQKQNGGRGPGPGI